MPSGPQRSKLPPLITRKRESLGPIHGGSPRGGANSGEDSYTLYTDAGDYEGHPQVKHGMRLGVGHQPDYTAYAYPGQKEMFSGRALTDLTTPGPGGQGKLFGMHHEQGESTLDMAESTKSARVHFPAMMAIAAQDTMQRYGRQLNASDDRSGHSERIVQHLEGKLGQQFNPRQVTNHMTFEEEREGSNARATTINSAKKAGREIVTTGQLRQGQQTARGWVGKPPIQGPKKPDHEQLTLF